MPRQDGRFVGPGDRIRARIRERRRRVLSVLGEALAFSLLIGAFPPLRAMWVATGILAALMLAYLVALLRLRSRARRPVAIPDQDLAVVRTRVAEPPKVAVR